MSKNWFEQNMNKKLSGSPEDFDLDANWKAIQAKRSKKKRRVIYFWFVLPAVLIILASGSMYLSSEQERLIDTGAISAKHYPLASGNQEDEIIESTTQNEIYSNTALNNTTIPQTVKYDEKNDVQKYTKTTQQKKEIAQTSQFLKAPLNVHSEDVSLPEMNSETEKINDEPEDKKAAFEISTDLAIIPLESKFSLLPESAIELEIPFFGVAIETQKINKPTNGYWIGASAMYGLQTINRSGPENLFSSRQTEEEAMDIFQAGFEFGVKLNKHWSLQTGLNFIQFTDKREYKNTEIYSVIDSNFLVSKIMKADGSMQDIYGVAEIPYVREINETSYNRYRHMELPVILAWETKLSKNFTFRAGAGVSLGLISSRSGSISDQLNTQIPLSQASYKSRGQLAALIRIEWMYTKSGWSAGIIIQGRSDLLNQLKPDAGYTERRTAQTFGLAYRIHL